MARGATRGRHGRLRPARRRVAYNGAVRRWIVYTSFVIGCVIAMWVPLYNRVDPTIAGVPFFYWFQMAWVIVVAAATAIAYRLGV